MALYSVTASGDYNVLQSSLQLLVTGVLLLRGLSSLYETLPFNMSAPIDDLLKAFLVGLPSECIAFTYVYIRNGRNQSKLCSLVPFAVKRRVWHSLCLKYFILGSWAGLGFSEL